MPRPSTRPGWRSPSIRTRFLRSVEIQGLLNVSLDAAPGTGNPLTLEGDGPADGGYAVVGGVPIFQNGNVTIPIDFSMTAAQVAQQVVTIMDAAMNVGTAAGAGDSVLLDPTQTNLVHMISHSVVAQATTQTTTEYGPLPYSIPVYPVNAAYPSALPGDLRPALPRVSNGHTIQQGQDNNHEGFYVDDVVVGFDKRGTMITDATADTTFNAVVLSPAVPSNGSYVLQIRRAPQYGTYISSNPQEISLDQSYDVNDRQTSSFTLQTPAGVAMHTGDSFSLYDGVTTDTFEFVLQGLNPAAGHIPIYFSGLESASEIASLVNTAINSAHTSQDFGIFSAWNGTPNLTSTLPSNRVDLFNCQVATADDALTADMAAFVAAADAALTQSMTAVNGAISFVVHFTDSFFLDEPVDALNNSFGLFAIPGDATGARARARRSSTPSGSLMQAAGGSGSSRGRATRTPTPLIPARPVRFR